MLTISFNTTHHSYQISLTWLWSTQARVMDSDQTVQRGILTYDHSDFWFPLGHMLTFMSRAPICSGFKLLSCFRCLRHGSYTKSWVVHVYSTFSFPSIHLSNITSYELRLKFFAKKTVISSVFVLNTGYLKKFLQHIAVEM